MMMLRGIFQGRVVSLAVWCSRSFSAKVEKSLLSKLRKKTGFSFINCKKALQQFDNDLEQAEKWLREEAKKEGWAKATKLQHRPMSNGLVGMVQDLQSTTMIEINCETDFVARNEKFQGLVSRLANACQKHFLQGQGSRVALDTESLNTVTTEGGQSVADLVAVEVGNIGENMSARRAVFFRSGETTNLGTYVHASGPEIKRNNCRMGKYGSIVELRQLGSHEDENNSGLVSTQLCQHIVGMNPQCIGDPESDEPLENKDEETKLIFQDFIMDSELTVGEFLKENGVEIVEFVRYDCGEELQKETSEEKVQSNLQ